MIIFLILVLVLLVGIFSVMLVGIVGGPIKAETPIVTTTLPHFVAFMYLARSWPDGLYYSYFSLLILCVVAQIIGIGWVEPDKPAFRFWIARGILAAAYVSFIFLILSRYEII